MWGSPLWQWLLKHVDLEKFLGNYFLLLLTIKLIFCLKATLSGAQELFRALHLGITLDGAGRPHGTPGI